MKCDICGEESHNRWECPNIPEDWVLVFVVDYGREDKEIYSTRARLLTDLTELFSFLQDRSGPTGDIPPLPEEGISITTKVMTRRELAALNLDVDPTEWKSYESKEHIQT